MEGKPDSARKRASREATEWSILLRDDPGDRDLRQRFQAWRQASPLNQAAWSVTERASDLAAEALPLYADEWRDPGGDMPSSTGPVTRVPVRRRLVTAGVVAIAACVAYVAAPAALLRMQSDYVTSTAEVRNIELPDGSAVTLAPGSAIAIAYDAADRRISLLQGEAFFVVKPDPDRPFRVAARSVEASVLGTRFDVRLEAHAVVVAVQAGKVQVDSPAARAVLELGQAVRVGGGGEARRLEEAPNLVGSWRQGWLYLQNRALGDAVDDLRRYFGGTIIVTDGALLARPTTGVFNLADPEEALRGIAHAHGATVRLITPWLLVMSGS